MVLRDYGLEPSGIVYHTILNGTFPSVATAYNYRRVVLGGKYVGEIETLDGGLIKELYE